MSRALIGLGGNLGDPLRQMAAALRHLDAHPAIVVESASPVYRTPPWGRLDQPDFLNACAALRTPLAPAALLRFCLDTEAALHRERRERWGPRTIDIDLIDHDGRREETADLVLPHPRARERAFVLVPLADIAPDLAIDGQPVSHWLAGLDRGGIALFRAGGDWWREGA